MKLLRSVLCLFSSNVTLLIIIQYIQDDFVKERRDTATTSNDEKKEPAITSDDLVHRMITAR
jgi:hypothetical protein